MHLVCKNELYRLQSCGLRSLQSGKLESPSAPVDPLQPSFNTIDPVADTDPEPKCFWLLPVWSKALLFRTQPFPQAPTYPIWVNLCTESTKQADCPAPLQILPGGLTSVRGRSQESLIYHPHTNMNAALDIYNMLKIYWGKLIRLNIVLIIPISGHVG